MTLYGTGNYCGKAEHYFTISENAAAAPSITTSSLPDGKVGEAYSQTLSADRHYAHHMEHWRRRSA